jgi:hypothetical protein
MAVDPALVEKDMYGPHVGELDERVVRGGWTYYVQAVKRPGRLGVSPPSSDSLLAELLIVLPLEAIAERRARRRPWTVGVVRIGDIATWNDREPVVVHREELPLGEDPSDAIAALAADAAAGRFAPGTSV